MLTSNTTFLYIKEGPTMAIELLKPIMQHTVSSHLKENVKTCFKLCHDLYIVSEKKSENYVKLD